MTKVQYKGTRIEHLPLSVLHVPTMCTEHCVIHAGGIAEIEKNFLALLDVYVHRVLGNTLTAKKIQGATSCAVPAAVVSVIADVDEHHSHGIGREVSPRDLLQYVTAYSEVFKEGKLPKPMTLVRMLSRCLWIRYAFI